MSYKSIRRIKKSILLLMLLIAIFLIFDFAIRNRTFINSIATSLYKAGKKELAAKMWERKTDAGDKDPIPEANLAKSYYQKGEHSQAEELYSQAIKEQPEHGGIAYDKGNAQYRQDKLDDALKSYLDAMLTDARDQDAKSNYELVLNRKGYKMPKPEDAEKEPPPPEPKGDYENTLNALDQMEPHQRNKPQRGEETWGERWW